MSLKVRRSAETVLITGPKEEERELRDALQRRLQTALQEACPDYFGVTGWVERTAFQIAWGATFVAHEKTRTIVKGLNVEYSNDDGRTWKPWIEVNEAPTDRRRAIESEKVSSYAKLREKGLSRSEAREELHAAAAKARAKVERRKKKAAKKPARSARSSKPKRKTPKRKKR